MWVEEIITPGLAAMCLSWSNHLFFKVNPLLTTLLVLAILLLVY